MSRLIFIGGGGLAKEVDDLATLCGHEVVGYVGLTEGVLRRPYFGPMEGLGALRDRYDAVILAFGAVSRETCEIRRNVVRWIVEQGLPTMPLISPYAIRGRGAEVAGGAIIAHAAILGSDSAVGPFSLVNTQAAIGHDTRLGANVTVAPTAFIAGSVVVGDNTLIGPGALILQGRTIGRDTVVGMGATLFTDLPDGSSVMPRRGQVQR